MADANGCCKRGRLLSASPMMVMKVIEGDVLVIAGQMSQLHSG
jgi:hypothetical protein